MDGKRQERRLLTIDDIIDICVVSGCGPISILLYWQAPEHPMRIRQLRERETKERRVIRVDREREESEPINEHEGSHIRAASGSVNSEEAQARTV